MSNEQIAKQIADLIHSSFHNARAGVKNMTAIAGATQAAGDVRKELILCAVKLKRQSVNTKVLNAVEANILVAQAMGLVTDETADKIHSLLDTIDMK